MPLTYFDFCYRTACYVAAAHLQSSGKRVLRYTASFAQLFYVLPDTEFCFVIHILPFALI